VRILVTGGAGFIGSGYVRAVLADQYPGAAGAAVTVLDAIRRAVADGQVDQGPIGAPGGVGET